MSALRDALGDYLAIRRGLGFKLAHDERDLSGFVDFLNARSSVRVTVDLAVAWVTQFARARRSTLANRMTAVRGFATYLHAIDWRHQIPPGDLFPHGPHRAVPYLYSDDEITALVDAAAALPNPRVALTIQTLIALLAVTGMRISEALALDVDDVNLAAGMLTVRRSKYGRSRLIPLHPHAAAAIGAYLRRRGQLWPCPTTNALFLTITGTRKQYAHVSQTFARLVRAAELAPKSPNCRPRLHDLRHTFAVRTLIDWYRDGGDVQARLPLLSTYLGHREPKYTYWYLQAAPELLAEAAGRLDRVEATR